MSYLLRPVIGLLLAGAAACGSNGPTGPEPLLDALPRQLSPAESRLIDASNQFSFDLFREATRRLPADSNAFLSPFSASMALGMALNGAGGLTFDSMRVALRAGEAPLSDLNSAYRDLLQLYTTLDRTTELVVANGVWVDQGFPVRPEFLATVRTWFAAEATTLDLQGPDALGAINGWVKERTRNRIPKLLEKIDADEIAFLVNAVYFKGRWRIPFDPKRTSPREFRSARGESQSVPTMWLEDQIRYAQRDGFQAADLLYGNGAYAMTILLPEVGSTPGAVLATLTPASWRELDAAFHEAKIVLTLPKFTFDYRRSLVDDLKAMGMRIAFDAGQADFYGIADVRPERLYLTQVLQKAFVEVNEEGTEAAATTAVGVGVTSAPPSMTVDRPFLFVIRERLTGNILFIGQVNELQ